MGKRANRTPQPAPSPQPAAHENMDTTAHPTMQGAQSQGLSDKDKADIAVSSVTTAASIAASLAMAFG